MKASSIIILVALVAGCASAPAPTYYPQAPAPQTACDAMQEYAESVAEARQVGVPRSAVESVIADASPELRNLFRSIIAAAYDVPGAASDPEAFGRMFGAVCRGAR